MRSDSPVLSRLSGCWIDSCDSSEFDEGEFETSAATDEEEAKVQLVEGRKSVVVYNCPGRISTLQVIRNAEAALKKSGFTSVYSGRGAHSDRAATLRKGNVWASIQSSEVAGDITDYQVVILEAGEMEQEMVADATAWADEIARSGRVAVYGILFDIGKATIQPAGEPVLQEIVTLLESDPELRLRVEGHTDIVGGAAANKALSEQRANAVVAWLTGNGSSAPGWPPRAAARRAPVADNATEEGRAKNRRVELVKM